MMINAVEHYLSVRQTLGHQLRDPARRLRKFAAFAATRDENHVVAVTAVAWAGTAPSPHARHIWYRDVKRFARFMHGEDPGHEVPVGEPYPSRWSRPPPHIYSDDEIARVMAAVPTLKATYPLKHAVVATLIGLLASTGLRVREALKLRFADLHGDGHLVVRQSKFRKSRLVPMHPTVVRSLALYLQQRQRHAGGDDHLFVAIGGGPLPYPTFLGWFHNVELAAGIESRNGRLPRIHDLRHTFATRSLERCASNEAAVSRHQLALSTYLGHSAAKNSYWYLESTPELMVGMASAAEAMMWERP